MKPLEAVADGKSFSGWKNATMQQLAAVADKKSFNR